MATQTDLPIAAVADFFGDLPEKLQTKAKNLPATRIRPCRCGRRWCWKNPLQQHKRPYETRIYWGVRVNYRRRNR